MSIKLRIEDGRVRRMLEAGDRIYQLAAVSALNRTAATVRTHSVKKIAGALRVPQKHIRKRMYIRKARFSRLTAELRIYARPLNPAILGATKGAQGVTGLGRSWPSAFIARGKGGKGKFVFRRQGADRLPLDAEKVPIFTMADRIVVSVANLMAQTVLAKELDRQLTFRLNRAAR